MRKKDAPHLYSFDTEIRGMILACTCDGYLGNRKAAAFQDAEYGKGMRVHNKMTAEDMFRCSICLNEKKKPGRQLSKKELKALKEAEKREKTEKASQGVAKRR